MKELLSSSTLVFLAATVAVIAAPALDAAAEPRVALRPAFDAGGVDPVTGVKAFDPAMRADKACVEMNIACNSTVAGVLDGTDCPLDDGTRIDFWLFQGLPGMTATIDLMSTEFDTYLFLLTPLPFQIFGQNDDGGTGTNSRLVRTLDQAGDWAIGANGFGPSDLGNYTLSLECVGGTLTPPAAPSDLVATPLASTEIRLSWNDNANNEDEFRVEVRGPGTGFDDIGPVPINTTLIDVILLDPATTYDFRVRARNSAGDSPYSNIATATTLEASEMCTPSATNLCLLENRFKVEVEWRDFEGDTGPGMVVPFGSPDSGLFWFFDPDNWEMLVKMVDTCGSPFDSYWVFSAATTNVEYTLRVTDSDTGVVKEYFNPLGEAAPANTDTDGIRTCPAP